MALRSQFVCRQCRINAFSTFTRQRFNQSPPIIDGATASDPLPTSHQSIPLPKPSRHSASTALGLADLEMSQPTRLTSMGTAYQSKRDRVLPPHPPTPPPSHSAQYSLTRLPPSALTNPTPTQPLRLSSSLRAGLPHLASQPPFYVTIHLHGFPYLVTAGDTLRLPFLVHGVMPGDILRLNRASVLGSRDWTLRAGAPLEEMEIEQGALETPEEGVAAAAHTIASQSGLIVGKTEGLDMRPLGTGAGILRARTTKKLYLDERLFTVRAVVMGTETEPLRILKKTKARQRKVKQIKSKHRFTILKIREVTVNNVEELEQLHGAAPPVEQIEGAELQ